MPISVENLIENLQSYPIIFSLTNTANERCKHSIFANTWSKFNKLQIQFLGAQKCHRGTSVNIKVKTV